MQDGLCGMIDNMYARDYYDPLGVHGKKKKQDNKDETAPQETSPKSEGDILRVWKEQTEDGSTFHVHTTD